MPANAYLQRKRFASWKLWSSAIGVAAVGFFFFLFYGSTDETVYHFKSVTQWLDSMAMFDELRNINKDGRNSYRIAFPPEVVTNDPAVRALLAMGSKAVPTLEKTLKEPPHDTTPWMESWTARIWQRLHGAGTGAPASPPTYYGNYQEARMLAAGVALLALGSNNHAGALRLLELEAATRSNAYQNLGPQAFAVASAGLPERHQEIIAGILAGLNHTNTQIQLVACSATQFFRANLPAWKNKLMELAQVPDADVNKSALWALACANPNDEEIEHLCERVLQNKTNQPRLRCFAVSGLRMAGEKAGQALPLLRAVLTEQGVSQDGVATFSADDITDWPGLINRLKGNSDPPSDFLWERLSDSERLLLTEYTPSAPGSKKAQQAVVQVLQKTVRGPGLYTIERFKGVSLRPETTSLLNEHPAGLKLARLNRLLLEDAFPLALARAAADSNLQRVTREAIDSIEKSLAQRDGKGNSTARGN